MTRRDERGSQGNTHAEIGRQVRGETRVCREADTREGTGTGRDSAAGTQGEKRGRQRLGGRQAERFGQARRQARGAWTGAPGKERTNRGVMEVGAKEAGRRRDWIRQGSRCALVPVLSIVKISKALSDGWRSRYHPSLSLGDTLRIADRRLEGHL